MVSLMSRTARIYNDYPSEILLKIVKNPGGGVIREIRIPSGGFKYLSYEVVDNFYNNGCQMCIQIFHNGKRCGNVETYEVRDYETLRLGMGKDEGVTTVLTQEGFFLARLGISWEVRDAVGKMKKLVMTKSEKKRKRGIFRKLSGISFR